MCGKFALQFSDEFVGNGSKACIAKGKDHKQYEYGNKVSIVSTKDTNIIVGVASHDKNIHWNIIFNYTKLYKY
jgi:hypothetical protein